MKQTPILYSAPMVRANLAGTKTHTRRIMHTQPAEVHHCSDRDSHPFQVDYAIQDAITYAIIRYTMGEEEAYPCPYGQPGDRLWGKETFIHCRKNGGKLIFGPGDPDYVYRADSQHDRFTGFNWTPSIFMPREASRIHQEILTLRVERVQDITEQDAKAEGVTCWKPCGRFLALHTKIDDDVDKVQCTHREAYQFLWNSINLPPSPIYSPTDKVTGKRSIVAYQSYPWSTEDFGTHFPEALASGIHRGKPITITPNPWVWVIEYINLPQS